MRLNRSSPTFAAHRIDINVARSSQANLKGHGKPESWSDPTTEMAKQQRITFRLLLPTDPALNDLPCRDSVVVNWAVLANATANTSDTTLLKACYSPFSRVNRPWRAINNIIAVCLSSQLFILTHLHQSIRCLFLPPVLVPAT